MNSETILERLSCWFAYLPIRFAYRIIWLAARTGNADSMAVYKTMWNANLDLPPISKDEAL